MGYAGLVRSSVHRFHGALHLIEKLLGYFAGDGYRARAIRSTGMTLLNFGGDKFLRLASNLILTRLLFPEAFGMMALVGVITAGALMFSDLGFGGAVIQDRRGEEPAFLNTVWTLQILRGILLAVVIVSFSGPIAAFYEEPMLAELLWVSALVPLIKGTESTKFLTANRTLQLERVTAIRLGSQLFGAIVTIALAFWLQSIWALVIGNLFSPILLTLLSHTVLQGHSDRLGIERAAFGALFRYGGFIFIASIAGFFGAHGDRAVLGKFVSLEDLAIYGIAMTLAALPLNVSNAISGRVIFPLYARRPPAESQANRRNLNKARFLVTAPLLLITALFAVIGDWLIQVLYDARYEAAGPYLVLIALANSPLIILQSYMRIPLASGHSGRYAIFQGLSAIVRFGLLLLLVPYLGLLGAILMSPLATLLLYPVLLVLIRRYKAWDLLHDTVFFAFGMALTVFVVWLNGPVIAPLFEPLTAIYTR